MIIAAVGQISLGSQLAHAINIIKTAGGFVRRSHEVHLFCCAPQAGAATSLAADFAEPGLIVHHHPLAADKISSADFGQWAALRAQQLNADLVYARHFETAIHAASLGLRIVVETHAHPDNHSPQLAAALALTNATPARPNDQPGERHRGYINAVVTIAPLLRDDYIAKGAHPSRVHVIADGVDVTLFGRPPCIGTPPPSFPHVSPVALYSGHLYDYKGIPTLLDAASLAPDIQFVLLGGLPQDIAHVNTAASGLTNVHLPGMVPHTQVPAYLWHADCLLLPPSARHPSAAWTSPVKLGEYLASGTPIVTSAIPALGHWLTSSHTDWFSPDTPASLVAALRTSLARPAPARLARAKACYLLAQRYSYQARAGHILAAAGLHDDNPSKPLTTPLSATPHTRAELSASALGWQ